MWDSCGAGSSLHGVQLQAQGRSSSTPFVVEALDVALVSLPAVASSLSTVDVSYAVSSALGRAYVTGAPPRCAPGGTAPAALDFVVAMMSRMRDAVLVGAALWSSGGDILALIDFAWAAARAAPCTLGRSVVAVSPVPRFLAAAGDTCYPQALVFRRDGVIVEPAEAISASWANHGVPLAWIEDGDVRALIGVMSKVARILGSGLLVNSMNCAARGVPHPSCVPEPCFAVPQDGAQFTRLGGYDAGIASHGRCWGDQNRRAPLRRMRK